MDSAAAAHPVEALLGDLLIDFPGGLGAFTTHRNTFLNAPSHLLPGYGWRGGGGLFFAGQVTGVEGYLESAASGLLAGVNADFFSLATGAPIGGLVTQGKLITGPYSQPVLAFDSTGRAHAMVLQKSSRATFVHPYDDPDVIAGQGTIGMEILRQCEAPIDAIFVAVGGGGLIGGIASYVKRVRPEIRIIGVEPVDSAAMARSLEAGRRVKLDNVGLFADGA